MKQALLDVLKNYLNRTSTKRVSSADEVSIFQTIPSVIREILADRKDEFKIEGSIGQGHLADVPWICVLDKEVTETPQRGIYIVLLFSADMSGVYLSLNQGVTDFRYRFGAKKKVLMELKRSACQLQNELPQPLKGILKPIDLKSKNLGSFYNEGNIQAFYYPRENLPSKEQFRNDFLVLLYSYDRIVRHKGTEIHEEDFQLQINECASNKIKRSDIVTLKPNKQTSSIQKYRRDLKASAFAIQEAHFCCEVEPTHHTFTAKKTGENYVEAHHLIPLRFQGEFGSSLDIPENIVSLCPNCHKLVHYGVFDDKKTILSELFKKRKNKLIEFGINLSEDEFLDFYKN